MDAEGLSWVEGKPADPLCSQPLEGLSLRSWGAGAPRCCHSPWAPRYTVQNIWKVSFIFLK